MTASIAPLTFRAGALRGDISVPGDKSISHRALLCGALDERPLTITGLNPGADVRATAEALIALGASVETHGSEIRVSARRLRESMSAIDCMNSGSTARMLLGFCAGANVPVQLTGDASLCRRPMEPVAAQLRAFGARITTSDNGTLPAHFLGRDSVETRDFILVSPSAQVKSALLFAGAVSQTPVTITGDRKSRDHTERLFAFLGADIEWNGTRIDLRSAPTLRSDVHVPGDFSSAAFFITAATVTPGSRILIKDVNVNPTRTGLLDILLSMGAAIEVRNERMAGGEPLGDIAVEHAVLRPTVVSGDVAVRAIDELQLAAVAAAFAGGTTKITGVRELRSKESDRVAAIERLLDAAGIAVEHLPNGLEIIGGTPAAREGAQVATHDDHRTAMCAAVLASGAGTIAIDNAASIGVSFPDFVETLRSVQA